MLVLMRNHKMAPHTHIATGVIPSVNLRVHDVVSLGTGLHSPSALYFSNMFCM